MSLLIERVLYVGLALSQNGLAPHYPSTELKTPLELYLWILLGSILIHEHHGDCDDAASNSA